MSLTVILLIVCVIVSYLCFNNQALFEKLKHWPYFEVRNKEYHRMLTSGFVHGSWLHLIINMFIFWQFGEAVEMYYQFLFGELAGRILYFFLFIATIIFADVPTLLKHKDNIHYSAVGASGAVSGIIFVSILFDPWQLLYLYGILPIPGIVAGVLYLIYSSWASKNSQDNIDHDAHFYGALFGMLFTILLKPSLFLHFIQALVSFDF